MSTDNIKKFYVTVSILITLFLFLIIAYGCYNQRRRQKELIEQRIAMENRRKSRGSGQEISGNHSPSNSSYDKQAQQKLLETRP